MTVKEIDAVLAEPADGVAMTVMRYLPSSSVPRFALTQLNLVLTPSRVRKLGIGD